MEISQAKKKEGIVCCAYGCYSKPIPKKGGLCHKHYRKKRTEVDPVGVRYNDFKHGAKKRGKFFSISIKEFRQFCKDTGYLHNGYRGKRATLDRIKNYLGYTIPNLQIITGRANIHKYWNHDRYEERPEGFEVPDEYLQKLNEFKEAVEGYEEGDLPF